MFYAKRFEIHGFVNEQRKQTTNNQLYFSEIFDGKHPSFNFNEIFDLKKPENQESYSPPEFFDDTKVRAISAQLTNFLAKICSARKSGNLDILIALGKQKLYEFFKNEVSDSVRDSCRIRNEVMKTLSSVIKTSTASSSEVMSSDPLDVDIEKTLVKWLGYVEEINNTQEENTDNFDFKRFVSFVESIWSVAKDEYIADSISAGRDEAAARFTYLYHFGESPEFWQQETSEIAEGVFRNLPKIEIVYHS